MQPTPVFLPRKSQERRKLVGYCPWDCKESDTIERLHFLFFHIYLWLIHVTIWQKPTQYCKAIILQLKINKKKKNNIAISKSNVIQSYQENHISLSPNIFIWLHIPFRKFTHLKKKVQIKQNGQFSNFHNHQHCNCHSPCTSWPIPYYLQV